jgi:hypothetical protein
MRAWQRPVILVPLLIAAAAVAELAMGRVPLCRCGTVKLWHGIVLSSENSQHITDWYSFSHVIHGIAFYAALRFLFARRAVPWRLAAATLVEAAWEVFENTPFVIERYRAVTISLDYYGDSVLNSVSDIVAMVAGFWIAHRSAVWVSLAVVAAFELFVLAAIRDNLTLNILMLVHPIDAIKQWQGGG